MDLGELTIETAKPLIGNSFRIIFPDGTVEIKLDKVTPYAYQEPRAKTGREPFSLLFRGDPSILLPQGMYSLLSDLATWENLFLVPVARDANGTHYEAVFT